MDFLERKQKKCKKGLLCWIISFRDRSYTRKATCCQGIIFDVLVLFKIDLGVDFYVYEVVDGKFGAITNGSWNGLIGEVVSGKADMAADFLTVSEIRLKFVDFPEQFLRSEMIMASKVKTSFLSSLNFEVFAGIRPVGWALIFGITFVTSLFIYWSERLIPYRPKSKSWVRAFTYAFGLFVQRG